MDSVGSGSLQSSSGGDDQEYDSRVSSFLNSSTHFNIHHQQQPQPPLQPPSNTSYFDPTTQSHHHHLDNTSPFSISHPSQNPLYSNSNNDPLWSRNLIRSDPTTYNTSSFGNNQSLFVGSSQSGLTQQQNNPFSTAARGLTPQQQPDHHHSSSNAAAATAAKTNPKKRTRASRRAPTTVLTTDTSNFRQMVQEFTGIPAAPFSAATSSFSRRLDLFGGGGSTLGMGPLYPLRPSAQKLQISSQFSSPSFLNSQDFQQQNTTTTTTNTSDQIFQKQTPQSLLNLQNPLFTFQSLLQQNTAPPTFTSQKDPSMNNNNNNLLDGGQQVNQSYGADTGENVRGYKLNTSEFQGNEKSMDNNIVTTSRGTTTTDHQGNNNNNVDSWICPSD